MADTPKLEITLICARGDPSLRNQAFQQSLLDIVEPISGQIQGMSVAGTSDAVYVGRFAVKLINSQVMTTVGLALFGWFAGRWRGRKVRLKMGDAEAEARTLQEVEKFLSCAQEILQGNQPM